MPALAHRRPERTRRGRTRAAGVALAALLAFAAAIASEWIGIAWLGFAQSPVPPALVAIALGLAIRNAIGLPVAYDAGLRFCVQRVLRVGVACWACGSRSRRSADRPRRAADRGRVHRHGAVARVALTRWLGLPARLGSCSPWARRSAATAQSPPRPGDRRARRRGELCGGLRTHSPVRAARVSVRVAVALRRRSAARGPVLGAAIHDTAQVAGAGSWPRSTPAIPPYRHRGGDEAVAQCFMIAVVPARRGGTRAGPPRRARARTALHAGGTAFVLASSRSRCCARSAISATCSRRDGQTVISNGLSLSAAVSRSRWRDRLGTDLRSCPARPAPARGRLRGGAHHGRGRNGSDQVLG